MAGHWFPNYWVCKQTKAGYHHTADDTYTVTIFTADGYTLNFISKSCHRIQRISCSGMLTYEDDYGISKSQKKVTA